MLLLGILCECAARLCLLALDVHTSRARLPATAQHRRRCWTRHHLLSLPRRRRAQVMMSWLAKLCGLPTKFLPDASSPKAPGGVIQSTSSEAVLVAMLAARARAMKGQPHEETLKLVAYGSDQARVRLLCRRACCLPCSACARSCMMTAMQRSCTACQLHSRHAVPGRGCSLGRALATTPPTTTSAARCDRQQAHSCYKKAAMVLGLQHVRLLHGQPDRDYALDPQHLADAIAEDLQAGLRPFFFMATVGTTSSCAVDPLRELGTICRE